MSLRGDDEHVRLAVTPLLHNAGEQASLLFCRMLKLVSHAKFWQIPENERKMYFLQFETIKIFRKRYVEDITDTDNCICIY